MGHYVVTAVRFDKDGEVEFVQWARTDGVATESERQLQVVPVDRVVEAFDRADTVNMRFPTTHGHVSEQPLIRKVLSGGIERVKEQQPEPGRMLQDMPAV